MRHLFPALLLAFLAGGPCTPACAQPRHTALRHHHPAQEMLSTLESMTRLLNSITSRQAADSAAPRLTELHREYCTRRAMAENMPPMPAAAMELHLTRLDTAMNRFRLACARVMRAGHYKSPALNSALKALTQEF